MSLVSFIDLLINFGLDRIRLKVGYKNGVTLSGEYRVIMLQQILLQQLAVQIRNGIVVSSTVEVSCYWLTKSIGIGKLT